MMLKRLKKNKVIAGLLIFVMLFHIFAGTPMEASRVQAASRTPGLNARVTKNNVLKVLNQYDRDGAYILKKQIAKGDNVLTWFNQGRILDGLGTAVHEETHGYLYSYMNTRGRAYFVGKKKTVYVPHTQVYNTKEMAKSVPGKYRTFRFNTYIGKPVANLSSNVEGAYGLLNEFMAYRAGMNTDVSLYPYLVRQKADWDEWKIYINECENGKLAYAEFKYYILHYLFYAKAHYPDVYRGIMNNKKFREAYRKLESSYAKLIRDYERNLKKLKGVLSAKKGYSLEIKSDYVWLYRGRNGQGIGRYTKDYKKLQKEMKKSKYQSIHRKLIK